MTARINYPWEFFSRRHALQLPIKRITPAVIGTAQTLQLAAGLGDNAITAVLAAVIKGSQLTAWLSEDEGATWQGGLMLDERKGISYPDGFQAPDGTVVLYVLNNAAEPVSFAIAWQGKTARVMMAASAVETFSWPGAGQ